MAARTLDGEVKLFITHLNARMHTPSEVVAKVKEQYGVDVTSQNVQCYDPTTYMGRSLSKELVAEFHAERERFRQDITGIPIANPAYRLRKLQEMVDKNSGMRFNPVLVASLMEQAAKETGGAYTNRRDLSMTGANGGPIKVESDWPTDLLAKLKAIANAGPNEQAPE